MDISKTAKAPCKGCTDRFFDIENSQSCHSSCPKYQAYKQELENKREYFNELRDNEHSRMISNKQWEQRKSNIRNQKRRSNYYKTC